MRPLILACMLSGSTPASAHAIDLGIAVSLEGTHLFQLGDRSNWAKPTFNDQDWQPINVPGRWVDQGFDRLPRRGWYRIRFDYPDDTEIRRPALVIGKVSAAFEV